MHDTPIRSTIEEREYQAGFARVMRYADHARLQGWKISDRQLVHEIVQSERAAHIREKSSLPMLGELRSAAWNHGRADALRALLRTQRERYGKGL